MSRLDRAIKKLDLYDEFLTENGWHAGTPQPQSRTMAYFKGPDYIIIKFSKWFYRMEKITWWNLETHRLNVWDPPKDEQKRFKNLIDRIVMNVADPTDNYLGAP